MTIAPLLLLAAMAYQQSTVNNYPYDGPLRRPPRARLVWSDEFNGSRLNKAKWEFDTARNKEGWFNGERQYYSADRPKNLRLERGRLIIEAWHERLDPRIFADWGGQEYTSAKIHSKGGGWTY